MIWYVTAGGETCGSSVGGSWSSPRTRVPERFMDVLRLLVARLFPSASVHVVGTVAAMKRRRLYSGRCDCVKEQSFTDFCPTQRINRPIVREELLRRPGGNIIGLATKLCWRCRQAAGTTEGSRSQAQASRSTLASG
jgi:hypothetical protein